MVSNTITIMENNQEILNLLGVWPQATKQDFHYGAKAISYQSKLDSQQLPETWLGSKEYLGEISHPFEDVLLPEADSIEPDVFMKDLENFDIKTDIDLKPFEEFQEQILYDENYESIEDLVFGASKDEANPVFEEINSPPSLQTEENLPTCIVNESQLSSSHPPIIKINVKKVIIPKNETVEEITPSQELVYNQTCSSPQMTLKEALNLGCADSILNDLMEVVQTNDGESIGIEEFSSYICSDSEDSYDAGSPSSFICTSPSYSSCESVDDDLYTIVTKDEVLKSENSSNSSKVTSISSGRVVKRGGRRPKRTEEEKKLKKMEQNKRAATRYRQKKKSEEAESMEKLKIEEKKHEELKQQYKDLKYQIRMMKKIMREFFIAKGLVSVNAFK